MVSNYEETPINIGPQNSLKSVKINEPRNGDLITDNQDILKKETNNLDESGRIANNMSHPISAISKFSEQVIMSLVIFI
jgi:hypothetical protein